MLSDHVYLVAIVLLTLITLLLLTMTMTMTKRDIPSLSILMNLSYPDRAPAISAARTWTNIFTAVAILAVDFQIFPRRFAKTETYGTGIMDVGVGCYIICHGLTSSDARNLVHLNTKTAYLRSLSYCLKKVVPFLVIGLLRLVSVRAADYQQHTSEYGVHWNFFFTIAAVKVGSMIVFFVFFLFQCMTFFFCQLLTSILAPVPLMLPSFLRYASFGTFLISVHQLFLTKFGVMEYIIYGPNGDFTRNTLFSANREGICSIIGYLALYYFGTEIGRIIHSVKR